MLNERRLLNLELNDLLGTLLELRLEVLGSQRGGSRAQNEALLPVIVRHISLKSNWIVNLGELPLLRGRLE